MRRKMELFLFLAVLLSVTDHLWAGRSLRGSQRDSQRVRLRDLFTENMDPTVTKTMIWDTIEFAMRWLIGLKSCSSGGVYVRSPHYDLYPLPQCPEDMGISMKVYTRQNSSVGETITRNTIPSSFKSQVMTMFIVHGWRENENYTWMHVMKDAVIAKVDYNVIIVGWKEGAKHMWYPQSASNTRAVGGEISLVANNLIKNRKSSKTLLYCVGHSLGAHVCGHAGQRVKFGRITGLDPAGLLFKWLPWSPGLNPSCADLVDVIHTNGFGLGMLETIGHIDFYPNGGIYQTGCVADNIRRWSDWNHFTVWNTETETSSLQMTLECSHVRAIEFFTESIATPCFLSRHRCSSAYLLPGSCTESNNIVQSMGFNANAYPERGIFYLETNDQAPFCAVLWRITSIRESPVARCNPSMGL